MLRPLAGPTPAATIVAESYTYCAKNSSHAHMRTRCISITHVELLYLLRHTYVPSKCRKDRPRVCYAPVNLVIMYQVDPPSDARAAINYPSTKSFHLP